MSKPRPSLHSLLSALQSDSARPGLPFERRFAGANSAILTATSDADAARILRSWLHVQQPCLFGRMAAGKPDLLSFCVLSERDLVQPDSTIRQKIQDHRLDWKRRAYNGQKSGFLILASCRQLVEAAPDVNLLRFATRLAELYLLEEIFPDEVYHDRVRLELSDDDVREWVVGVNFFGAQGDGRWWQDHRIPGGIAFSMNSIGHMIRSGSQAARAQQLATVSTNSPSGRKPVVDLNIALRYAMQSIQYAQNTTSGPATCLRPLTATSGLESIDCPLHPVPPGLSGMDWTTYLGWYDTDHTLPSVYFRADVERPDDAKQVELDFSYLFDENNIDYHRTGPGVRTR